MGILYRAKAPLRISFAGGGTDVPPFVEREGGCVLSATIDRYVYAALRPRDDRSVTIQALDYNVAVGYEVGEVPTYDGKLDLAKATIRRICPDLHTGFDVYLHADVAPGSGLGSSSTMVVAMVALLKEHLNLKLTEYDIADLAYQIERVELGIRGGYQDQYAAAFGGFNFIEFQAGRVTVNPLRVKRETLNELEANLMLVYVGNPRLSARIIEDQVTRYERGDTSSVEGLRKIKTIAYEMKSALLRGQLTRFGELLHEEWLAKRRLSPKISGPELDQVYDTARSLGALGGKLSGAGGGGFMQLYCPFDKKHKIADRLREMGCTVSDVGFSQHGVQTWVVRD